MDLRRNRQGGRQGSESEVGAERECPPIRQMTEAPGSFLNLPVLQRRNGKKAARSESA